MQKTKVVFLILPHIHLMDLAGPDQVFLEAIGYGADFELHYCSPDTPVASSSELPFGKLKPYAETHLADGDLLLIPGCELSYFQSPQFTSNQSLFAWIRSCYEQGAFVGSICSGAFALAQTGLLNGKQATTHWKRTAELQELYPKIEVLENVLFTEDGRIFTSAGIASGIDLALHLVEQRMGQWFAHKVAREMVIYNRRNGNQQQQSELLQFRNHIHSGIHSVQDWLHENLHASPSLESLADRANMSSRNLTRIFKKETSLTVNEYITLLRKEKIRQLMNNPDITRDELARKCGLKSERQISRILNGK